MATWMQADWLLGRRFVCDFVVTAIGAVPEGGTDADRDVCLDAPDGGTYAVRLGELQALIESGLAQEPAPGASSTLLMRLQASLTARKGS